MQHRNHQLPHAGIQNLIPYVPGKSIEELAREQGLTDIIKMASNENPLGCSQAVLDALARLDPHQIATYPAPNMHPFKEQLCSYLGVATNELSLCNGSDFLFTLLLILFALHTNKHMLTHDKAFSTYPIQANTLGIPVVTTPISDNWQVDIQALANACNKDTGIIFLANPNNPTGQLIPQSSIVTLLESIPETTMLVIDEAYYEYAFKSAAESSFSLLKHYSNLIITRTFSKAYGLAGLRLGYALSHVSIYELIQKVMLPFTVNQVAMIAASAALDDQPFVTTTLELNATGKHQLMDGLTQLNCHFLASACNFITFDAGLSGQLIYQKLLTRGIIIRPLNAYNLPNHLRVTIGTETQNQRFLDNLALILKEERNS